MVEQVEISSFDLRYEDYRMKNANTEKALIASIVQNGINEPLQGVDKVDKDQEQDKLDVTKKQNRILLDGFKRYRCAKRLGIAIVPYSTLSNDEALGLIALIRMADSRNLTIPEQAKLIDVLKNVYKMSVTEIANRLEKSKGWVSMRIGMMQEISPYVMNKILGGEFPAYSYMYTLRSFIRMNGVKKEEVDEFVNSVAGKNLSIRDISQLAHGYFNGSEGCEEFRQQIKNGDILWVLNRIKETCPDITDCTELERQMLKELEITQKYMMRVTYKSKSYDYRFKTNSFYAQANLLADGILKQLEFFSDAIRRLHDRTRQT